ncbi:MAG: beta-lactamase family protein [Alphaproteobacteria bacterium]|nr:beta-lactamase family protein [Alphaproteobacteria bacterium]
MSMNDPLNTLLQSGVEQGQVFGVAAAVTDRDGVLYEGAFGERALGGGVSMTTDTVGWIASMTKAITGAAIMQLVEQNRLDLDAPASQWAPYLGEVQVLDGFDDSGAPVLRAPKTPITLRHLLTHSAGFGYANWNEDLKRYSDHVELPLANTGDIRGLMTPLVFDPGERWLYSISIDWAGKILEKVTGQSLGAYFDKNIFQPLGMTSSGFKISPDMRARMAKVHRRQDGGLVVTDTELKQDPPSELGGGGLYSTVEDYLKFVRMILNEGQGDENRILAVETVRAMSKNQMGDCRVCMLPTTNPGVTLDAEFFPGLEKTWGLTFMINNETAPTGRSANSLAWAGLANSYYWIDPTKGVAGVYLTQILPFVDEQALSLYLDFETAVYDNLS